MKKVLLIAFILISFTGPAMAQLTSFESNVDGKNLPFQHVAIGIASPGPGVSKLGHAFLLFMKTPKKLSQSYAVQFNVDDPPGEKDRTPEFLSFFGVGKRFSAEAIAGLVMMNRYRAENRAVILYVLNLRPAQISTLWQNLRAEHIRREAQVLTDYNFLNRNCMTESLRYLNAVLDPLQQKFVYLDSENNLESLAAKYLGLPGLFMKNAPYVVAPQLAKHPLVVGAPIVLTPAFIANAKWLVTLQKQTLVFAKECNFQTQLDESSVRINGQPSIRESQAYMNLLAKFKKRCTSKAGLQAYDEIIKSIYFLAESPESKLRVEGYLP